MLVFPALALFIGLDYLILRCLWKEEDKEVVMKTEADLEALTLDENERDEDQTPG